MTTKIAEHSEQVFTTMASRTPMLPASQMASSHATGAVQRRVPSFIPVDQVYYWSSEWQRGEAETRANLEAGNAKTFNDPMAAVRHLLNDC